MGQEKAQGPRQPKDQRYQSLYIFGSICPARGTGAALAMPWANTHAMQAHPREISRQVAPGAHAALLLDCAGWHITGELKIPKNITLLFLPSKAPELNPVENIWQFLRQTYLSNRGLRNLRADPRCPLPRPEPPHRPALENHVYRIAQLGPQASLPMTAGISLHTSPPARRPRTASSFTNKIKS